MASATNAVQGLNQTIDLLQRILSAVESGNAGSRAATPRNLGTALRTTAATGSLSTIKDVGNAVTSLSPLSKINKKTVSAADDMANVIKTVSSKDVVGGIMRLGAARPFMGLFESSMKLLVKAINAISSLHVTQRKIALFSKAMASIEKDVVKPLTKLLLSLPILIAVSAGIGFLARGAFKTIMTGFGTIALIGTMTVALMIGLNIAVAYASKVTGTSFLGTKKSGMPPIVNAMLGIMLSFTGLVLISGLVGLLGRRHIKTIMNGFWTIAKIGAMAAAVLIGFNLVFAIIKRISSVTNLGDITKNKTGITVPGVKEMALIMLSFAAMVLIAAGTGMIAQKNFLTITLGLQIIGLIAVGMIAVVGIIGLIGKFFGDGVKNMTHGLLMVSLSLLIITGIIYAITFVAKQIDAVGKESVLSTISIVVNMLKRLTLLTMGLMLLSLFTPDVSMKIAIAGLAMVTIAMLVMVGCLFAVIKVAEKIEKYKQLNDGRNPFDVVSSIAPSLAKMILILGGALGLAYTFSPLLTFHILALGKLVNVISKFVDLVSKYEADGENITPIFYNADGTVIKGAKVNIVQVATNIASALGKFVSTLVTELDDVSIRDVKKMAEIGKRLNKIITPVSSFVNTIKGFNSDGKSITINRYDKDGNITRTDAVNLEFIATNISTAFSVFATTLDATLDKVDIDYWAAKEGERIGKLIDPVTKFIDCISKINITGTDEDLTIETVIDGVNVKTKPITTITHIGTIYSKFSKVFESIDTNKSIFGSNFENNVMAMAEMFNKLSSVRFNDMDAVFSKNIPADTNSTWKMLNSYYVVPGTNQSLLEFYTVKMNDFTDSFDDLCHLLFKNEKDFKKTLKSYTESVSELATKLDDVVDNLTKMTNTNISINATSNVDSNVNEIPTVTQNRSTGVTESFIDGSTNKMAHQFDIDELSDRIAAALKNAINGNIRISFPDPKDDIIAMLQA